jgi:hypothetical protein
MMFSNSIHLPENDNISEQVILKSMNSEERSSGPGKLERRKRQKKGVGFWETAYTKSLK